MPTDKEIQAGLAPLFRAQELQRREARRRVILNHAMLEAEELSPSEQVAHEQAVRRIAAAQISHREEVRRAEKAVVEERAHRERFVIPPFAPKPSIWTRCLQFFRLKERS